MLKHQCYSPKIG